MPNKFMHNVNCFQTCPFIYQTGEFNPSRAVVKLKVTNSPVMQIQHDTWGRGVRGQFSRWHMAHAHRLPLREYPPWSNKVHIFHVKHVVQTAVQDLKIFWFIQGLILCLSHVCFTDLECWRRWIWNISMLFLHLG